MFWLLIFLITLILIVDLIFLPRSARRAWWTMAAIYSSGLILVAFPLPLEWFAAKLGVGRPIDVLIYIFILVLIREFFLSRERQQSQKESITQLVRAIALEKTEFPIHGEPYDFAIVVPCYNDSDGLHTFLVSTKNEAWSKERKILFVVVDDGSNPEIALDRDITTKSGAEVVLLRHPINLGQGAALQTGLDACNKINSQYIGTMDSDGQHQLADLADLWRRLVEIEKNGKAAIVFGNRFGEKAAVQIPASRRYILKAAVLFERFLTGLILSDAHNGYRLMNRAAAAKIKISQNRMAHATEIKQIVSNENITYSEAPVSIRYTRETLNRGQRNTGSLVIIRDLLKSYLFSRR